MASEPTVICPKCKTEFKLTESLAAPLIEATRREFQERMDAKDSEVAQREVELRSREGALEEAKTRLDEQVSEKLRQERAKIAVEEGRRAKLALGTDLEEKAKAIADLQEALTRQNSKLAEAQKAQADILRMQRDLDDAKQEMDLTIEKRVQAGLGATRDKARKEAEEALGMKVLEKEQTITSMQQQIEALRRKAEQGSQQLQGEVLELELEALLRERFPNDLIEAVPKGEHGGDILHHVSGPLGQPCGTILWESKRTKNWSDGWLPKLRGDQREAKAEIAVIVTQTLPKTIETFEQIDGIWVTHPRTALPVAFLLRQSLIDIAMARRASDGQQTKMELVYQYLTGLQFRRRVEAMIEAFSSMKEDLDKEKKAITKQWAKREGQIQQMLEATAGMHGDLQGIAGKTLPEIDGLELTALSESNE